MMRIHVRRTLPDATQSGKPRYLGMVGARTYCGRRATATLHLAKPGFDWEDPNICTTCYRAAENEAAREAKEADNAEATKDLARNTNPC